MLVIILILPRYRHLTLIIKLGFRPGTFIKYRVIVSSFSMQRFLRGIRSIHHILLLQLRSMGHSARSHFLIQKIRFRRIEMGVILSLTPQILFQLILSFNYLSHLVKHLLFGNKYNFTNLSLIYNHCKNYIFEWYKIS